jgi:hypothetical protein
MAEVPPVLQRYINGLKTHDVQLVASAVSDDLAFVTPSRTLNKPQFLDMLRALYEAFADWHYDHLPPEVSEEAIAIKWRQCGTHSGIFAMPGLDPIDATGRTVTIPEQYFFYKIRDDQIIEIRPDPVPGGAPQGILVQIGVAATTL